MVGMPGPSLDDATRSLLHRGVAGVILFTRNCQNPDQLQNLTRSLRDEAARPLLIAIDHEGGRVHRFPPNTPGITHHPPMRQFGHNDQTTLTAAMAANMADELLAQGINVNFAPVLDVDTHPDNPIIADRSFGRTPDIVARHAVAMIHALQSRGVAACGKHFPGHGDTHLDSHTHLPHIPRDKDRLYQIELPPFQAAILADVEMIMIGHLVVPALDPHLSPDEPSVPAPFSHAIVTGQLRERMGFRGVVVSDDLEMAAIADRYTPAHAAVACARGGVDLLLMCHRADRGHQAIDALEQEAAADPAFARRCDDAATRITRLAYSYEPRTK